MESEGLRNSPADVQRQEKIDTSTQAERANLPLLHHFVPFTSSRNWMTPVYVGEGNIFYPVNRFKHYTSGDTFPDTSRKNVFPPI